MAKKPDDVEREIAEQRQAISRKLEGLQARIEHGVEDVKQGVGEQTSSLREQANRAFDLESQVREYPLATLAGALGVGVVLGLATDPGDSRRPSGNGRPDDYRYMRQRERSNDRESGILSAAYGSLGGLFGTVVQDEIRQMMENGLEAFVEKRGSRNKRQEPGASSNH